MLARAVLLAAGSAVASAAASVACATMPLHVSTDLGTALSFAHAGDYRFPHVRTPVSPEEAYRVGDATGADSSTQRLYAVKGPGAGEVTLIAAPACPVPTSFADGAIFGRDLHVSTTGSPTGDGSPANPFDTLQRATTVAGPGDRILIHEGSYPGSAYITDLQGTAAEPIQITGVAGEQPPVLGSSGVGEAIHLVDPAWVILQDLVVAGPTGNGINIDDGGDYTTPAHHVEVRRVEIRDIGTGGNQDCLKLSGLDDFHVLGSTFLRCGAGGSGIDMVGCHRGRIAGNSFRQMGANAIQGKGGSAEVSIHGNLMVDAGQRAMNLGGSTGLAYFRPPGVNYEARDLWAVANVVVGSDTPAAYVGCDRCLVANNTFYLPAVWVARILQETTEPGFVPCREGRFINNIVVFDSATLRTFVNVGPNTAPETFVFANNLWFSRDDPTFSGPTLPVPESDPIIQRDPGLSDPAAEDFDLTAGSPAIDAGTCLAELSEDRDGVCYGDPPTLGAHEVE